MANLGTFLCVTDAPPESACFVLPGLGGAMRMKRMPLAEPARHLALRGVTDAGSFVGSVQEAGAPVPNCVVRCYERASGAMIAEVRTDAAGAFTIFGVQRGSASHYAIALDPEGGAVYNGLIFDRIIPV